MQTYISIRKAASRLKAQGNIHLIHLLFGGKLLSIGSNVYLSAEQYQECRSKDCLPVK